MQRPTGAAANIWMRRTSSDLHARCISVATNSASWTACPAESARGAPAACVTFRTPRNGGRWGRNEPNAGSTSRATLSSTARSWLSAASSMTSPANPLSERASRRLHRAGAALAASWSHVVEIPRGCMNSRPNANAAEIVGRPKNSNGRPRPWRAPPCSGGRPISSSPRRSRSTCS